MSYDAPVNEVDYFGNCSNCGGVHIGTGTVCVEKQNFPRKTIPHACPHNALRRCKDEMRYPFDAYICGNCAKVFEVSEYVAPPPEKPEPLGKKAPWGTRARQA